MEFLDGKLCDMLFTQTGSRFIQKQLSEDTDEDITSMEEIKINQKQLKEKIQTFTTFILDQIGDKVNEIMIDR